VNDEQRRLGLDDLTSRLNASGLSLLSEHWQQRRATYCEIGTPDRLTNIVVSDEFLCDLPATREYQSAVEAYALAVAGRIRCGPPNVFYCLSNKAVRMEIRWPIEAAMFQDKFQAWLLVTVKDEGNGSVARCCVDVDRQFAYSGRTIFDDIRNSVNKIRRAIDKNVVLFYRSLTEHPEAYQPVNEGPAKAQPTTLSTEIEKFIAGKAYMLGFQAPEVPGEVFAIDPWDADYLSISKKELSQSAYKLRARGLLELDMSLNFARPSDKLVTAGWPAALGPDRPVAAPQIFELSCLPRKEDLAADLKSALEEHSEFAVIFVDLDRFKEVNDTKGHAQGDSCLDKVIKAIGRAIGSKGKVYRWGGDEFAISLADFSTEEALVTAERTRRAIEASKAGGDIAVTASIGVCGTDRFPNAKSEQLLDAADKAMYASKRAGKNRVTAWPF
jgi:diguanylate cyclase (GGDEF)-like protein